MGGSGKGLEVAGRMRWQEEERMVLATAGEKELGWEVRDACTGKLESGVAFGSESPGEET